MRLVRLSDGCGAIELWAGPEHGWVPGGDATMLLEAPAPREFLRVIGIPEPE